MPRDFALVEQCLASDRKQAGWRAFDIQLGNYLKAFERKDPEAAVTRIGKSGMSPIRQHRDRVVACMAHHLIGAHADGSFDLCIVEASVAIGNNCLNRTAFDS